MNSFVEDGVVTLRVGPSEKTHDRIVHRTLLRQHSPFFDSALQKDWKENKSNIIELPEDDVKIVDLYISWVYRQNPFVHPVPCQCSKNFRELERFTVGAWQFGDKVLDHPFCDLVIDVALAHGGATQIYPLPLFSATFDTSARDAPVHNLLGDAFVYLAKPKWLDAIVCSAEAYKEIARRCMSDGYILNGEKFTPSNAPWIKDPCVYHLHKKNGGICYKDKVEWGKDIVVSVYCSTIFRPVCSKLTGNQMTPPMADDEQAKKKRKM